ncbi:hypothetical protein P5G51_011955 [Virgibacillus sp. 179-BFC.A HS]|uniref:Uncharacterized protein n=1 Tax=Tigheibacillus jepli TaxID=3035914 RepID=A0ABU5CIF8_9BACI|nr:hypothetical protein [Virgibacillus sp. 179-BFC.A HS]MDY0406010.1 hypothetical protein [Virgibacillus sp. 179-BFC.A HS]
MKYVMETLRRKEEQERLPVIRMEIDYELMTLYDAMQENDSVAMIKAKERLKQLSAQLKDIEES